MAYKNLQHFIDVLEKAGELVRIKTYVNPALEIAEMWICAVRRPSEIAEEHGLGGFTNEPANHTIFVDQCSTSNQTKKGQTNGRKRTSSKCPGQPTQLR